MGCFLFTGFSLTKCTKVFWVRFHKKKCLKDYCFFRSLNLESVLNKKKISLFIIALSSKRLKIKIRYAALNLNENSYCLLFSHNRENVSE